MMRHVYIRGILALVWLAVAIVSAVSGNPEMTVLYVIMGGVFLYSAYSTWKREKNGKGDK